MSERIDWLVENLNNWTKLYDEGRPAISDAEWDSYYFELVKLETKAEEIRIDSPTQRVNYSVVNELEKVRHSHPMLSLSKTKERNEISNFLGNQVGIAMAKMDGLTISLTYTNGKLVRAETRGDGEIGEDVTNNAYTIPSIPHRIDVDGTIVIDGEVICTYEDFQQFEDLYANPRNFAAGSIRLLDNKECQRRKLTFVAWDLISADALGSFETLYDKLTYLSGIGFIVVPFKTIENEVEEDSSYDYIVSICNLMGYPIDGLVFKYNDCEYYNEQGKTSHHFRGGMAFKFYDEEFKTTLIDVKWSMGRTGQITPIAIFEPINSGESIIERASLHNISVMEGLYSGNWKAGLNLYIYKANQIIPQVSRVEAEPAENDTSYVPCTCPICNGNTVVRDNNGVKTLWCENPQCEGKLVNQLDYYCGKKGMDIRGLSLSTLQKLIDWGWVSNIYEIYSLSNFRNEWIEKEGFGEKSVDKILDAIEESRQCSLDRFIASLGIPLIGNRVAKDIINHIKSWRDFRILVDEGYNFAHWDGFGPEKSAALLNFDYSLADKIAENYLSIEKIEDKNIDNSSVKGLSFVITGKLKGGSREKYKKAIEDAGGRVVSAMSSKVNYLINNDNTSQSSKNIKAIELGKSIITEDEFIAMFNIIV